MGLGINYFKGYKILDSKERYGECGYYMINDYYIQLLECESTSHSYHNVGLVQDLLYKYTGEYIPRLPYEEYIDSKNYKIQLIEPSIMSEYCKAILLETEVDKINMRDRFEWFKKMSDDGYYIAYDCE